MKIDTLAWLRFSRGCRILATEVGYSGWIADVWGCTKDVSIEVEIKTSTGDFHQDFSGKKKKHIYYNEKSENTYMLIPNYMYYLIPDNKRFIEIAEKYLKENYPKYGLLTYHPDEYLSVDKIRSVRRVTKLHSKEPTKKMKDSVLCRMSTEICSSYLMIQELTDRVKDFMHSEVSSHLEIMKQLKIDTE